jgi:uncharacterized DUF497 family protein
VVYTKTTINGEETIRIISARAANSKEYRKIARQNAEG